MKSHHEKKLASKEIFDGKIIKVTVDTIELENGASSIREIVHHNGGAGILALNSKHEIALVHQYRYAVGKQTIEIPAGKIEPGEEPLLTAKREMEEEAGCTAAILEPFGSVLPTCAYCTEVIYIYYATGLQKTKQNLDADEFLDVEWVPLQKAVDMVLTGEINDSKTSFAILKAYHLYTQNKLIIQ